MAFSFASGMCNKVVGRNGRKWLEQAVFKVYNLGVIPDKELHDIMVRRFGAWGYATKKVKRQLYWLPKLKYTNRFIIIKFLLEIFLFISVI